MYQTYDIFDARGEHRGSVAAASPEEALYRVAGGWYGRTDWKAVERGLPFDPRPGYATTWPDRR